MRGKWGIFLTILTLFLSCKTAKLSDARAHFTRGEYHAAVETYRKLYRSTPREQRAMRGVIAYEMAENYRQLNQSARAVAAYRNAIRYNYPDTLMFYHYARMLHREGNYDEAVAAYTNFLEMVPGHAMALTGLKGVEWARGLADSTACYSINQKEVLASSRSDFSPVLTKRGDRLYFTSSREAVPGESRSPVTGMKYYDLFYANTNVHGVWQSPRRIETSVNTDANEATPAISPDGEWMYYTFSQPNPGMPAVTTIHVSRRVNGEWSGGWPVNFEEADPEWSFAHPSPSSCGKYLYFVSDRPGGYGGYDIWRGTLEGSSNVGSMENMGPGINTPGNELFPYARNDSTIYFSSDGHPGMGGLDLFLAVRHEGTQRWGAQNMGSPINSSADDFGITFFPEEERGFFSSNRNDARGYGHIYSFEQIEASIRVEGIVVDHEDGLIPAATVRVVGNDGSRRHLITNGKGEYRFTAEPGVNYLFQASAEGFLNGSQELEFFPQGMDTLVYVDFEMVPFDKPVVMKNILYDFDSATLRPESKEGLDQLVRLMQEHPEIEVELAAHTDRVGSDEYNRDLSARRARAVVSYLQEQGVEGERLTAVGYGKSRPAIVTRQVAATHEFLDEGVTLSEEFIQGLTTEQQEVADQVNRRTEFTVMGKEKRP